MAECACLTHIFAVPGSLDCSGGTFAKKTVPFMALWPATGVRTDIPRQWHDHSSASPLTSTGIDTRSLCPMSPR